MCFRRDSFGTSISINFPEIPPFWLRNLTFPVMFGVQNWSETGSIWLCEAQNAKLKVHAVHVAAWLAQHSAAQMHRRCTADAPQVPQGDWAWTTAAQGRPASIRFKFSRSKVSKGEKYLRYWKILKALQVLKIVSTTKHLVTMSHYVTLWYIMSHYAEVLPYSAHAGGSFSSGGKMFLFVCLTLQTLWSS